MTGKTKKNDRPIHYTVFQHVETWIRSSACAALLNRQHSTRDLLARKIFSCWKFLSWCWGQFAVYNRFVMYLFFSWTSRIHTTCTAQFSSGALLVLLIRKIKFVIIWLVKLMLQFFPSNNLSYHRNEKNRKSFFATKDWNNKTVS